MLNPAAWADAPGGTWGTSRTVLQQLPVAAAARGIDEFRAELQGGREGKYILQVRAEFQNIFNRLHLAAPSMAYNPALPIVTANYAGNTLQQFRLRLVLPLSTAAETSRASGQIVARFTF